jgi:hypothetical protein
VENWLKPRTVHVAVQDPPSLAGERERSLRFYVIDTAGQDTAATIRTAGALAHGLNAEIIVLAAQEVPLPLALDEPPVSLAFTENRLRDMVRRADAPARVDLLLCRDPEAAIRHALPPGALVVMGGRRTWFARAARKLATSLTRDGHQVVFAGEFQTL